jgi:hypothetical protein
MPHRTSTLNHHHNLCPTMSSSHEKSKVAKANRAISSRKRKAGDDDGALAITSTEKAGSSTTITPPEPRGRTELDNNPFHRAQIHAASTNPDTQIPSDQTRKSTSMANSNDNPTSAPSAPHPKAARIPTRSRTKTTQEQTSTPERHQVLRDLFRTSSNQTHQHQHQHENATTPQSPPPNFQPQKTSTPTTSTPPSPKELLLEEIDLRSPHDDPDYDIISPNEALHSSHNAQADHASKYPKPKPKTHRSSSSSTSVYSPSARKGFEPDDSSSGEETDSEFTSWRSYDFVKKTEAKHSARNAQADRASKYPELRAENAKGGGGGGGEKGKGWLEWLLS